MAEATTEELERFRRQWHEEVSSRTTVPVTPSVNRTAKPEQKPGGAGSSRRPPSPQKVQKAPQDHQNEWEYDYHDLEDSDEARKLGKAGIGIHPSTKREPTSALEHYEKAVERETEGSLGDSLSHYRRAYKVCDPVWQILMPYTDQFP